MSGTSFLITIMGIILAILAVCKADFGNPVVENWWGGTQFTTRAMPGAMINGQAVALGGNYVAPDTMGSGKFVSVPSFQSVLSPRFSNVQYGANIRYNMPDRQNMATPCDPLTFGSMADSKENYSQRQAPPRAQVRPAAPVREGYTKEGYGCANCGTGGCAGGCPPSCGKGGYGLGHKVAGGYELPSSYAAGNYWDVYNSLPTDGQNMGSELPIGTMSTMDGSGNVDQFIAFNRIMPANTKSSSRLRAGGDPIRGDLAIVPCQSGWFSVYPDIARDVQEGAMNVLAGAGGGGETYNNLMRLITTASGGAQTALGGVNLADSLPQMQVNMGTSQATRLSAAMGDVNVTAFP